MFNFRDGQSFAVLARAKWMGAGLSEKDRQMLLVPRGFAHGYASLEEGTEVVYLVDSDYLKESERGALWNDPQIGVKWPVNDSILSEKDKKWPTLKDAWTFS